MNYNETIRLVAKKLIEKYENDRKVESGINGPYDDKETEVRNLAHLIIITAIEILKYNQPYLELLSQMGSDLLDMRGVDGFFVMRKKQGKDVCNGVIGNAWVIESLVYLYRVFGDNKYLLVAYEIFETHKFQEKLGLWGKPGMGVGDEDIDYTLNHQLWLAAALYEMNEQLKDHVISEQLHQFMNQLSNNFNISNRGRIVHGIYRRVGIATTTKNNIKKVLYQVKEKLGKSSYAYKEEGYHLFNLVALARIYLINPEHFFFQSAKFIKAIEYANSQLILDKLMSSNVDKDASLKNNIVNNTEKDINIYGYPYNVPGFEYVYVGEVWKDKISDQIIRQCLSKQFELTYSSKEGLFGKKCHDKITINYRIYEYYRGLEVR